MIIIPASRRTSFVELSLLSEIELHSSKQLIEAKIQIFRLEFTKDQVWIPNLRILFLILSHLIKELHLSAPTRDVLQLLLSVTNFLKELEALVSLSLRLSDVHKREVIVATLTLVNRLVHIAAVSFLVLFAIDTMPIATIH
jgi:hypothetical protein